MGWKRDLRAWEKFVAGLDVLPVTAENVERAKAFVLKKYQERAAETGRERPENLHAGCRFAALFAQAVFGGDLDFNHDHTWLVTDTRDYDQPHAPADVLDLTDGVDVLYDPYQDKWSDQEPTDEEWEDFYTSDEDFMYDEDGEPNGEWWENTMSCAPRVKKWVKQFLKVPKRQSA